VGDVTKMKRVNGTQTTPAKVALEAPRDERGRYMHGGPGRWPGSRNKIGSAFFSDLYDHWKTHGKGVIETVCNTHPAVYLRVVASVMPRTVEIKNEVLDQLTDDEIAELIAEVRQVLALAGHPAGDLDATAE
jgi:hypothetical protein